MQGAARLSTVTWRGNQSTEKVHALMRDASALVFPSTCYETFGRVAIKSFAAGTPVIASNIGAIGELVEHGRTGLYFRAGDAEDLAARMADIGAHPSKYLHMRQEARTEFEKKYSCARNYDLMVEIYSRALARKTTSLASYI